MALAKHDDTRRTIGRPAQEGAEALERLSTNGLVSTTKTAAAARKGCRFNGDGLLVSMVTFCPHSRLNGDGPGFNGDGESYQ